ncbi:uncharacterized protein LOC123311968 [Coccinella septempunctata]|uniref:uncharacterized protein LOC123311968 n=1 Tax=Coccinella septempunctata TaxID=41139 RepID=UPI001D079503|nr:uncharacterized protein LOC123311968 [Coccinella septempunctata]
MLVEVDRENTMKNYVGNDLKIRLFENTEQLMLVGNNIRVKIQRNEGKINIVGDNCRVDIQSGAGQVKYTGNNGKFNFGQEDTERKFQYNGNNVCVNSSKENTSRDDDKHHAEEKEGRGRTQRCKCNPSSRNITISNSKHVRINSKTTGFRKTNPEESTPCGNIFQS